VQQLSAITQLQHQVVASIIFNSVCLNIACLLDCILLFVCPLSFMFGQLSHLPYSTVKPVLFACPLFREFCDLGNLAKITGR